MTEAALIALAFVATPSSSFADKVRTANFTGYNDLEERLGSSLNKELQATIKKENLAVFIANASFPEDKACYAFAGLTTPTSGGRHSRIPAYRPGAFLVMASQNWDEKNCLSQVTSNAIENFNQISVKNLLTEIESVADKSTAKNNEPENKGNVHLTSFGLDDRAKDAVFEKIHSADFSRAFDYRHVQTVVFSDSTKFDDGSIMCVVLAGLTARTPKDRNARWPARSIWKVRNQVGGTVDGCKNIAATAAVESLLKNSWSTDGLLGDFKLVMEDGVLAPNPAAVKKLQLSNSAPTQSKTTSRNVLSCENKCVNGSCLRTFSNGRQERWQAPRTYNPLTQNWEWDTTTNACGG